MSKRESDLNLEEFLVRYFKKRKYQKPCELFGGIPKWWHFEFWPFCKNNGDFCIKNGDFRKNNGDFCIKNGDFRKKNGDQNFVKIMVTFLNSMFASSSLQSEVQPRSRSRRKNFLKIKIVFSVYRWRQKYMFFVIKNQGLENEMGGNESITQGSAERRRPCRPRFPNSLFPSWGSSLVS